MRNLDRFAQEDFEPNEEDILRVRIRTTGIISKDLKTRYQREHDLEPPYVNIKMVDVGGQRNERKKWLHCFDDVKCVLFLSSMAGYRQVLFEDSKKNRMIESLELFRKISHDKTFQDVPIILFLNKKDLFEQMIRSEPLSTCFPDYKGDNSYASAFGFLKAKFREQLPKGKEASIFDVTGVARRDVKEAFQSVKSELLELHRPQMTKKRKEIVSKLAHIKNKRGCSMM
eukprot:CAMPEP_0185280580 /NCGR_PEP_ID=MMETSP1359-20130426/66208_1 /TAXON_ID=552665 /ORGANISM="Bigelowiella longifila, Strain CCMP242" /LENGTH=227 /DNA_ID=CAMNT_0027875865 /DNA_START=833 /DNA_END=1516 /DNA_ORIENTATION=+